MSTDARTSLGSRGGNAEETSADYDTLVEYGVQPQFVIILQDGVTDPDEFVAGPVPDGICAI